MGAILNRFWGSFDDNKVDPATGLTGRQKKLVQDSWAIVRKDAVGAGMAIMLAFFKKYPEYQQYFTSFKSIPVDELSSNRTFQIHCASVVAALNNVVDSLNDPAFLEANLISLGKRHNKRGQTKEQFNNLKYVTLDVLRQALGTKFTSETEEAWSKTIDAAFTHIFTGLSR